MTSSSTESLTYVIPTYNRYQFLEKALGYLAAVECRCQIHVADSSDKSQALANRGVVQSYASQLNVKIQHYHLGMITKCGAAVDRVKTPYTLFVADDDFQFPRAVDLCVEFLDQHPTFGTCIGRTGIFHAGGATVRLLEHRPIVADSPPQRYFEMALQSNYSSFYGVHRTQLLQQRFRQVIQHTDYQKCRIIPEIMLSQLCALQGKIGTVDHTSLLKLSHAANETSVTPRIQDPAQAESEYDRYRDAMMGFVIDQTPTLDRSQANRLVDRNFRLMNPAPLSGGPVMLNRGRRELRKFARHGLRSWHLGRGYPRQQKGFRLPTPTFTGQAREHSLAVDLINQGFPNRAVVNRAA